MNWQIVKTLVGKDLTLYFRDRFFAFITVLALVAYVLLFILMPASVDETLDLAVYAGGLPATFDEAQQSSGIAITLLDSAAAVEQAVAERTVVAGIVLTGSLFSGYELTLYLPPETPPEREEALVALLEGLGYGLSGQAATVSIRQEVIGADLVGQQIPFRDRVVPLFAVFVLMVETMGLASLITTEVESRAVYALLTTPMNMTGLFVSKGIMGVGLAFAQAALLMLFTGGLQHEPVLVLLVLLLGSLMVTGIAFLIASVARDMLSVIGWGILAVLVLSIPAMTVLFPGGTSDWMKLIPTYWLVDAVDQVANFGAGWGAVLTHMGVLLLGGVGVLLLGGGVLRRKLYGL